MSISDVALRLAQVRERVKAAALQAGRDPATVRLLAASKTVGPERVVEAIEAGQLLFGENRAQELRDKRDAVDTLLRSRGIEARPEWHYIGHVQTNKVRLLVGRVAMIQTVDRTSAAEAIARRVRSQGLQAPPDVLVEVNLAGESSKAGTAPDEALALCREVDANDALALRGLMTVPPFDAPDTERWFGELARLATSGRAEGLPLHELSMGMTGDFEAAIAQGATIIRLGTAIFGPRA